VVVFCISNQLISGFILIGYLFIHSFYFNAQNDIFMNQGFMYNYVMLMVNRIHNNYLFIYLFILFRFICLDLTTTESMFIWKGNRNETDY
jgi:hypothetical protein